MKKKSVFIIVTLCIIFSVISISVYAQDTSEHLIKPPSEIEFTYMSDYKNYKATCYYTDLYFNESSYNYNSSLSTMSLSLAMSAFNSADGGDTNYKDKSSNVRDLLKKIGFKNDDISSNEWYSKKPDTDSIGVICAHKPIMTNEGKFELVAVAIRGGGYEKEWASNFTLGKSGDHQGFSEAKQQVVEFIKKFIKNEKINGNIKIWITGFSRAGAVANLTAGSLVNKTDFGNGVSYRAEDVYAYTFEAPAGAQKNVVKGKKFDNIFNIINPNDIVPLVGPSKWGFARFGTDIVLSEKPDKQVLDNYKQMPSIIDLAKEKSAETGQKVTVSDMYMVDDFSMYKVDLKFLLPGGEIPIQPDDEKKNVTQKAFIKSFIDAACDDFFVSRSNYYNNFQNNIRDLFSLFAGLGPEQSEKVTEHLIARFSENASILLVKYIWQSQLNPWGTEDKVYEEICSWIHDAMKHAGVKNYDKQAIDRAGINLGDYLMLFALTNPEYTLTAVMNAGGIGSAHYPELCFAYLSFADPNYKSNASFKFADKSRRLVSFDGNADIEVYDTKGKLQAKIVDGKPVYSKQISHTFGIDKDGNKVIYLPFNNSYNIKINPKNQEQVNLYISEITEKGKVTRRVDYFDVAISDTAEITVPAVSGSDIKKLSTEGTAAEYKFVLSDTSQVVPLSDRRGKNAEIEKVKIALNPVSSDIGIVSGGGIYKYGSLVTLKAHDTKNYAFTGWYIEEVLLSEETEFTFRPVRDINVDARFSCRHLEVETRGKVKASCISEGNTGDVVCLVCGQIVNYGIDILPFGHTYVDYECTVCNELDPTCAGNPNAGYVNLGIASGFCVYVLFIYIPKIMTKIKSRKHNRR